MGKHDPRAILSQDRYVFSTITEEGAATADIVPEVDVVQAELWGPGARCLEARLPSYLGLDQSLIAADLEGLPKVLQRLRAQGLRRTLRPGSLMETLVPIILQQLVTWREAAATYRTLVKQLGSRAPGPFSSLHVAPPVTALRNLTSADLRAMKISGRRAQALMATARYAERIEAVTQDENHDRLTKMLMALPGMGPWTTAFYLGLELGNPNVVPTGDYHLPASIAWAFRGQRDADDTEMLRILKPYLGNRFDIIRLVMGANIQVPRRTPRMPDRPRV